MAPVNAGGVHSASFSVRGVAVASSLRHAVLTVLYGSAGAERFGAGLGVVRAIGDAVEQRLEQSGIPEHLVRSEKGRLVVTITAAL